MEPLIEKEQQIAALEKSNFRWKITSIILVVLALVFLIYGFVQKGIADEKQLEATIMAEEAMKQKQIAIKAAVEAEQQQKMAEFAAEQARRMQQQADEALQKASKK